MARYRVEFSREWIMGRWGFIDRMFHDMGGRPTEPSRLENAWRVEFEGDAATLGRSLSEGLGLKQQDFSQFGTIFEISEIGRAAAAEHHESGHGRPLPRSRRLGEQTC